MAVSRVGFLPCFSEYKHSEFPTSYVYDKASDVEKVKRLMSCLVDSCSPHEIKLNIGQKIQTIRPDSKESKRIIQMFSYSGEIYRIDYGNTPFRILFGLSHGNRMAHILAFDTKHSTYAKNKSR